MYCLSTLSVPSRNRCSDSRMGWVIEPLKNLLVVFAFLLTSSVAVANTPDFAQLYEESSGSVGTVETLTLTSEGKRQNGLGSAVLISEDELLTAAHVVDGADALRVLFKDGTTIRATVVASIEASDIALIKLQKPYTGAEPAVLGDSDDTLIGSPVYIIGSPFGISQTLSIGHLSGRLNRGEMAGGAPIEFLQTDTAINTGNSGGPMFNAQGEVIGIVSFILTKSGGFDGIGFATSINTANEALLSSSGILAGFEGVMLSEQVAAVLNLPQPGLLLHRVIPDSVAGKAGLKAGNVPATINGQSLVLGGDVILEINGVICATPHDFRQVQDSIQELNDEESYEIKVFRNGEIVTLYTGAAGGLIGNGPLSGIH